MELYLKDDGELENFFINDITENAVLEQSSGSAVKGSDPVSYTHLRAHET